MNDDRYNLCRPELQQLAEMVREMRERGETSRAEEMELMLEPIGQRRDMPLAAEARHPYETRSQRRARERFEAKQARRKAA